MEPELVERIKQAFLKLDPEKPKQQAILTLHAPAACRRPSQKNYEGIEEAARAAGPAVTQTLGIRLDGGKA